MQCIQSCIDQGALLKEIILVDDHSTDNSLEVIRDFCNRYPELIKVFSNPGRGANAARNYAFEKSSGKYIQWLDSDDFILRGKFEAQVPFLESGEFDIIYSDWAIDFYKDGEKIKHEQKHYKPFDDFLLELIKDNWTSPNNYLMNRKTAELLAGGIGWNPLTKIGQDREYFTMAGILGARFHYVPGTYAIYNKHSRGTISGLDFKKRLEENQHLEKRLGEEIIKAPALTPHKKKTYLAILDTHKLKACVYHPGIKLSHPINPLNVSWSLMHWKMRLIMPYIYIRKHLEFYL